MTAVIHTSALHGHLTMDSSNLKSILSPSNQQEVDKFCRELLSAMRTCLSDLAAKEKDREKALIRFHAMRLSQLPPIWNRLFLSIGMNSVCPLLLQSVNRRVFEGMLIDHLTSSHSSPSAETDAATCLPLMNAEEENALRYVSGYVALKLMRKYEKEDSARAAQFLECLSKMAVLGNESSFYDYTREWVSSVDRGGLLHVNDGTSEFFKAVELQTRQLLPKHLKSAVSSKETLVLGIKEDEDVQFQWSMLCVDIDSPSDSDDLLMSVIALWVTIRGFSLTSSWMEVYKKALQQCTSKKKALRKHLRLQQAE